MNDERPNPLLALDGLPDFSAIEPAHVQAAVLGILQENRAQIESLLQQDGEASWDSLVQPLELMEERLERVWSPVSHLNAVVNSPELREAYNACLADLSAYATELGQNTRLFRAFESIAARESADLDLARRKVLENGLRDFRLAGVHLDEERKARFKAVQQELAALAARFEENVLDATNAFSRHISDSARLDGLPEQVVARARDTAREQGKKGWVISLDYPNYHAVLTYAVDPALRREFYEAWSTRASDQGPGAGKWDNSEVIEQILRLRHETARLLEFPNYAELSLATKMAGSTDEVVDFLTDLAGRSRCLAQAQLRELEHMAGHKLNAWDIQFYAERLKHRQFDVSDEMLKPYFPVDKVISGLFKVAESLFGIAIRARDKVNAWHPDVRYCDVLDENGLVRGGFYMDLFARRNKRGGAWMDDCIVRNALIQPTQHPVAHLVCNFTPPGKDRPSLLTHDEVVTLFHEFGHTLHHLLTGVDIPSVSGINGVPWDAVELPSQFMENFAWREETLPLISGHYETGEALPRELFLRLCGTRSFMGAMHMARQLEFALFDIRLHSEYLPERGGRVMELLKQVRSEVAVIQAPEFNRFPHSFSHIFAGGYAAGYYSYKWAEVLAADAFSAFEENGVFDQATARALRDNILARGGSVDAMQAFVAFRGRQPRLEPLLRQAGIEPEAADAA